VLEPDPELELALELELESELELDLEPAPELEPAPPGSVPTFASYVTLFVVMAPAVAFSAFLSKVSVYLFAVHLACRGRSAVRVHGEIVCPFA
jgi:hypothetical protein